MSSFRTNYTTELKNKYYLRAYDKDAAIIITKDGKEYLLYLNEIIDDIMEGNNIKLPMSLCYNITVQ